MEFLNRLKIQLGGLPAWRVTWGLVLVFSVWVLLDVFVLKLTGGLSQSSFDAMVRTRVLVAAPDPRIVIIDIDEASLARMSQEFGRWPWPRDTLATVLNHLERQQPAAVVWDVLFADADLLSPGGDAAFNAAAKDSLHSHFSVVRLPQKNDSASQITQATLPSLWIEKSAHPATVALIPPVLPAIANSRLGFNNGYVDTDGVLRRYRYLERLPDGGAIQSMALSVFNAMDPVTAKNQITESGATFRPNHELISWRRSAGAYPHISFSDVFTQAEGSKPLAVVPSFAGTVILIGSTAPSLHDIHPTPLSPTQAGVDTLATVIDNALNHRQLAELPRGWLAALAIVMCVGLALWVQFKSAATLAPALLVLPATLLGISYLSLNGWPVFVDLHLAAALALVFLAVLRYWSTLRLTHWCTPPQAGAQTLALWPWVRQGPWLTADLDRLINALERHAPNCRVLVGDVHADKPSALRWPELARFAAIIGPQADVLAACQHLEPTRHRLTCRTSEPVAVLGQPDRAQWAVCALRAWVELQDIDLTSAKVLTP
jgi:adenylate cyclase